MGVCARARVLSSADGRSVLSTFGLLRIMFLLCPLTDVILFKVLLSVLRGLDPEAARLDHMVILCFSV